MPDEDGEEEKGEKGEEEEGGMDERGHCEARCDELQQCHHCLRTEAWCREGGAMVPADGEGQCMCSLM